MKFGDTRLREMRTFKTSRTMAAVMSGLAAIATITLPALAFAQPTQRSFVTDHHSYNLRSGESTRYRIISVLESGTPVEVLARSAETGYSKVQLPDGTEGFIRSRYLQTEPTAAVELKELRLRLKELEKSPSQLQLQLAEADIALAELTASHKSSLVDLKVAKAELEHVRRASENALHFAEQNEVLSQRVAYLEHLTIELKMRHATPSIRPLTPLDAFRLCDTGSRPFRRPRDKQGRKTAQRRFCITCKRFFLPGPTKKSDGQRPSLLL
jgi:SH3 domain protein